MRVTQHRLETPEQGTISQHRIEIHRYLRHANALTPGRDGRMQIRQRSLIVQPGDFWHKALDQPENAFGAVDETALDLARIAISAAIASLVEQALGPRGFFRR